MVLENWEHKRLQELCTPEAPITYGVLKPGAFCKEGVPLLQIKDLYRGRVLVDDLHFISAELDQEYKRSRIQENDILISLVGTIGRVAKVKDLDTANIHRNIGRIRSDAHEYLFHFLSSDIALREMGASSSGSSQSALNLSTLRNMKVPVPPIKEQVKIAKIISTWDEAIATIEQLLANSEQQKKALMQQLLTGKKRLPGFEGKWQELPLGELFSERKEAGITDLPLLSVTSDQGIINRDDVGRKDTSSADKSRYLRVCPGDIAYNTMRMWQGVSALSSLEGIVSPAYTVLKPKKRVDSRYAAYLFKLPSMVHRFYRHSQGLVSDTWNLKYKQFSKIKVDLPGLDEQKAVADTLRKADEAIRCQYEQLAQLKLEKKALMQQLLTGKRRVKIDEIERATA